jgi:hypothetical protein
VIWHQTEKGLKKAYERITGRTFYESLSQPVAIYHDRQARKTD